MYEMYIESKNQGEKYNVTNIVTDVSISFVRVGTATKMDFTLIKDDIIVYHEGDVVEFYDEKLPIFRGYIFTKTVNDKKEIKTLAYDQLRYLKAKQTYQFKDTTIKGIIETIANQFKLGEVDVEDIAYNVKYHYHENQGLFDIITYHIQQASLTVDTEINFYDNFGKLTLKKADNMVKKYKIGARSLATGYSYKTDIDSDTYNLIKLVKPNRETGKGYVYQKFDSETMAKWGTLQSYEIIDERLNDAEIAEYLKIKFNYHNKVFRTLSLDAVGIAGLRAGDTVYIDIPDLGDISLGRQLLIDSVTHKYKNSEHTMSLEMVVR